MNLLCRSAACCKEKDSSGDGHVGDHVVSVKCDVCNCEEKNQFSPGKDTWSKWKKFSEFGLNIKTCDFNDLRKEATRVLKAFVADPFPYISTCHVQCPLVPDFWRVKLDISDLEVSRTGIIMAHGKVMFITLQDIMQWNNVRPFKENLGENVKLSVKTSFKALL